MSLLLLGYALVLKFWKLILKMSDLYVYGKMFLLLWNLWPLKQNIRNNGNTMELVFSSKHNIASFPYTFPAFPYTFQLSHSFIFFMWHFNYRAIMKIKKISMATEVRLLYFYICVVLQIFFSRKIHIIFVWTFGFRIKYTLHSCSYVSCMSGHCL